MCGTRSSIDRPTDVDRPSRVRSGACAGTGDLAIRGGRYRRPRHPRWAPPRSSRAGSSCREYVRTPGPRPPVPIGGQRGLRDQVGELGEWLRRRRNSFIGLSRSFAAPFADCWAHSVNSMHVACWTRPLIASAQRLLYKHAKPVFGLAEKERSAVLQPTGHALPIGRPPSVTGVWQPGRPLAWTGDGRATPASRWPSDPTAGSVRLDRSRRPRGSIPLRFDGVLHQQPGRGRDRLYVDARGGQPLGWGRRARHRTAADGGEGRVLARLRAARRVAQTGPCPRTPHDGDRCLCTLGTRTSGTWRDPPSGSAASRPVPGRYPPRCRRTDGGRSEVAPLVGRRVPDNAGSGRDAPPATASQPEPDAHHAASETCHGRRARMR
jgi:hypothetical protein